MNHVPTEVRHALRQALTPSAALVTLAAVPGRVLAQGGGEGGGGGSPLFDINVGLSIWAALIFLILLGILWRFAWGPLLAAVEARENRIQGDLDDSARKHEEARGLLEEHRQQLAEARRAAQDIIAEGKAAGEKVRRDIEEKAREEGQALLERARNEIGREKEAALDELRKGAVDLALAAAARLMREKLDPDRDRQLIMGYLDDLDSRDREASA
ncbi:MAG TPA: F0F1 ATP synthase subunit B [Candidatus Methylomirabilis sp.]|jgi:F-type H+-transporting ATPase subunit b